MTEQNLRLNFQGIGRTWSPTNPGPQKASKSFAIYAAKLCNWEHQLCHRISPETLNQRLKVKSMRPKVFKEIHRQHRVHWIDGTKETSLRFKESVLMKVCHIDIICQQKYKPSVSYLPAGGDLELLLHRENTMPKAAPKTEIQSSKRSRINAGLSEQMGGRIKVSVWDIDIISKPS